MSNLLPTDMQRNWAGLLARVVTAAAAAAAAVALVCIVAQVPALAYYRAGTSSLGSREESALAADATTTRALAQANAIVSQLASFSTSSPAAILADALARRPQGVAVTRATYARGAVSTIVLTGTSKDRDAVNAYRAALAADSRVSAVAVPIAALVGTDDGAFSLTLTGSW